MTVFHVGDLLTGDFTVQNIPISSGDWGLKRNAAGTVGAMIPLSSRAVQLLNLPNHTTRGKAFLCAVEGDTVLEAGPIWRRTYEKNTGKLTLAAGGLWTYFDHRQVLPLLTASQGVIDPATGESASWGNTDLVNLSYGTMAKRIIQQSRLWVGGNLPIVFQDDEVGTWEKHFLGANLTKIGQALRNLVDLVNGVDIRFRPRLRSDRRGVEWVLETGTIAEPELHSSSACFWDYTVPRPSIKDLRTVDDASSLTSQAWVTGGRQDGTAAAVRANDSTLTDAGYALFESVDSSHSDASDEDTLMDYATNQALIGRGAASAWGFTVAAQQTPRLGEYLPGTHADIKIARDPMLPAGTYRREIASMSGDHEARWVKITAEETVSA